MMQRRTLLTAAAGGAMLGLSGCKVLDTAAKPGGSLHGLMASANGLTYRTQRLLGGDALAPEFTAADIRQGQKPNGTINPSDADYQTLATAGFADWRLNIIGAVENPLSLSLPQLQALPARTQITRHDCVEGWSCIAKWTGVPLSRVLDMARPKSDARFVVFHCMDTIERSLSGLVKYYESIDLRDAVHPPDHSCLRPERCPSARGERRALARAGGTATGLQDGQIPAYHRARGGGAGLGRWQRQLLGRSRL